MSPGRPPAFTNRFAGDLLRGPGAFTVRGMPIDLGKVAGAEERTGSWWDHWREWLTARSGPLGPAPAALGSTRHPPGVPAPGRYVGEA